MYLHHLPQLLEQAGLDTLALQSHPYHIGVSCLVLLLPGGIAAALHATGALIATSPAAPAAAEVAALGAASTGEILATYAKDSRPTNPGIANALKVLKRAAKVPTSSITGAKANKVRSLLGASHSGLISVHTDPHLAILQHCTCC